MVVLSTCIVNKKKVIKLVHQTSSHELFLKLNLNKRISIKHMSRSIAMSNDIFYKLSPYYLIRTE